MKFSHSRADIYVPDGTPPAAALARTTHLCVGAHQDDVEIMAHSAIAECFGSPDKFFTGVVVTDGAGAPRSGRYADFTDSEMCAVRVQEQRRAAAIGKYSMQIQLAHPSAAVKTAAAPRVHADLTEIFSAALAERVYLHNPADKHDTHVAVVLRCLEALRSLPPERRPRQVVGCEVWRDLDWLVDSDKVALDGSQHPELAKALLQAFDSQIGGGKHYDIAVIGRRAANATFHAAHQTDAVASIIWAMDLTPLVADASLKIREYTLAQVDRFRADVAARLQKFGG